MMNLFRLILTLSIWPLCVYAADSNESQTEQIKSICKTLIPNLTHFLTEQKNRSEMKSPQGNQYNDFFQTYKAFVSNCPEKFFSRDELLSIRQLENNLDLICSNFAKHREYLATKVVFSKVDDENYYQSYVGLINISNSSAGTSCQKKEWLKGNYDKVVKNAQQYSEKAISAFYKQNFSIPKDQCATSYVDTSNMPDADDQANLSWCHAWAVANLLSFHQKNKLSPYDIAVQSLSNKEFTPGKSSGSSISDSGNDPFFNLVEVLQSSKGICEQKSLAVSDENWKQLSELIAVLGKDQSVKISDYKCTKNFQDAFSLLTPLQIAIVEKLSPEKRVNAMIDLQCGVRTKPKVDVDRLDAFFIGQSSKEKLFKIDEFLSDKPNPIPSIISMKSSPLLKGADGGHAVTIVGRKYNEETGTCEYLVRNSWGRKCADIPYTNQVRCVDGTPNFWISRQILFSNALSATFISKD